MCIRDRVEVEAIIPGEPGSTTYSQVTPPPRPAMTERDGIERIAQRTILEEAAPASTALTPEVAPGKGTYLQLGAFANADNAENLKNHLSRELDWLSEPMRVMPGDGMHRLQLGPYASRNDAERVAEKIRAALGYKPTVVIR